MVCSHVCADAIQPYERELLDVAVLRKDLADLVLFIDLEGGSDSRSITENQRFFFLSFDKSYHSSE